MKILVICGAGMGTSVMMKIKLEQFLKQNNISAELESCSLDEGKGSMNGKDIVICSVHLEEELKPIPEKTTLISVENIMNIDDYGAKILALVNQQ